MVEQVGREFLDPPEVQKGLLAGPNARYECLGRVLFAGVLSDGQMHWATFRRVDGGLYPQVTGTFLTPPHIAVAEVRRRAHIQGFSRQVDSLLMLTRPMGEIR